MKKIFTALCTLIIGTQTTFASPSLNHQASKLYETLLPFQQTITLKSSKRATHLLSILLKKPGFIHKICGSNKTCNDSVFSFQNEGVGLINTLALEKTVIKSCNGHIECIKKAGDYDVFRMLEADSDYLKVYLTRYLLS